MPAPEKRKSLLRTLFAVLLVALAGIGGIWSATQLLDRRIDPADVEATRFPQARALMPFELLDHNKKVFNRNSLKGHWSFLFFGYTHCPDVCPMTLTTLNSVANQLQDLDSELRFAFVSVDPERDNPDHLARFVTYFNKNFIGLTGTRQQIETFTRNLGIMHMQVAPVENATGYLVDHTASVLLVDPDGSYHAVFSPPLSAEAISSDFRKIHKLYRQSGR